MPDVLRFERFGTGPGSLPPLVSGRYLLERDEVEYIVEEHSEPEDTAEKKVSSGKTFQLERKEGHLTFGFLSLVREDDETQAWLVYITKPPNLRPALPDRLAEVLIDKQPAREVSEIVEAYPFHDLE